MTLKSQAVSGVKWTTISMVLVTGLQLMTLMILARFLDPRDFGLMSIMMVVIGFAQAFMDMGTSNAIIQRKDITHTQLSSLYWLNIGSGFLLAVIFFLVSPLVAFFYGEPRFMKLMMILSSVFIIVAIGNQYRVLCQKELQFSRMAKIEITSNLLYFTVAVCFAVTGYGVYSLVFGMLIQAMSSSLIFLTVGLREHHRPALVYHHRELKGFYGFGLFQMGERSLNYLSANIDKLIIGKTLEMQAVGFYEMGWRLIIFPLSKINPIVNKVAFPVYARIQDDFDSLNRYYTFNVKALSVVTVPLLAFLSFFSHDVVFVVFGPGWEKTASLITVLSFVGIFKALGNPGGAIILALGRADIGFWWNLFWVMIVTAILIVMLSLVPRVETAAYTILALSLTVGMLWHFIIAKISKIRYWPIARHFCLLILITFAVGWIGYAVVNLLSIKTALFRIAVGGGIFGLIYCAFVLLSQRVMLKQILRR